jgi:hypothetical protein
VALGILRTLTASGLDISGGSADIAIFVPPAQQLDLTASIGPRRWNATLGERRMEATIGPRRVDSDVGDRDWLAMAGPRRVEATLEE